ncbi:MAG: hypothetical protein MZV49_22760 [Rhodopseudomonas palustris]|nr:hypothetical protein [Rhodopseudomonas palustris]
MLSNGVIAGVGSVLVFLPQILILFLFILLLEDCGYLPRAAFLLDRHDGRRRAVTAAPSFRCCRASPAPCPASWRRARSPNRRDRLTTILIAPLMTCSARLPVYALMIARVHPAQHDLGPFNLQGLVLFALYVAGIVERAGGGVACSSAPCGATGASAAACWNCPTTSGRACATSLIGLWQRAKIFLQRVGTHHPRADGRCCGSWSSFPAPPAGATEPGDRVQPRRHDRPRARARVRAARLQLADRASRWCPGMAAREVAVGALGTVYALAATATKPPSTLVPMLAQQLEPRHRAVAAGLVRLRAAMRLSTLAVIRRETGSWRWVAVSFTYMMTLAYFASFATYQIARGLGAG